MGSCELCGTEGPLVLAIIENTQFETCRSCGSYGRILEQPTVKIRKVRPFEEVVDVIVEDAGRKVREAREQKQMSLKDFAARLHEKESLLQKVESNRLPLSIDLARKLEKTLNIKLIEKVKDSELPVEETSGSARFTIRDKIKFR